MYVFKRKRNIFLVRPIDFTGGILFSHLKKRSFPEKIKKILVVRLDHLGDIVCSTPVFRGLKSTFPEAKICVLTNTVNKQLLEDNPLIDEVITLKANWFNLVGRKYDFKELWKLIKRLRSEKFDLGIDLRGDFRNIVLLSLGGVRYRVGFGIAGGGFLLNKEIPYSKKIHEVEKNIRLVRELGCKMTSFNLDLHSNEAADQKIDKLLSDLKISKDDKIICIHPGAGYSSKMWDVNNYVKIAVRLSKDDKNRVFIVGSKKEETLGKAFKNIKNVQNLIGKTSLNELVSLLARSHLFIGNDSGPSHLAAGAGIPFMIIASGTNDYDRWGAWGPKKIFFQSKQPCSPCELKICPKKEHYCMTHISVDVVYNKVDRILKSIEDPYEHFYSNPKV